MTSPFASLGTQLNTYTLRINIPSSTPIVDEMGTVVASSTPVDYSVYLKLIKDRKGLPELNSNEQYCKIYFLGTPPTTFPAYSDILSLTMTDSVNNVLKELKFQLQNINTSQFKIVNEILGSIWEGKVINSL
jgi:hypothetical protein